MRKTFFIISICIFLTACAATRAQENLIVKKIKVGDLERSYRVYAPKSVNAKSLPLVFVFHGGGGNGIQTARLTKFDVLAEKEKFIAVFPDGINRNWSDGREAEGLRAVRENVDDLAFVGAMIDALAKDYRIDEKRIYATGISNGAIFSHYVGAHLSEKFAAIAPVVGGIAAPFDKKFKPRAPVSVLIIQGTDDPLVPYDGGNVARTRGKIVSTDEAVRLWTENNKTEKQAVKGKLPDADKTDDCTVETFLWKKGKNNSEVELYKLIGGGHTWAGGAQYFPKSFIGGVCRDFDATGTIWEFFKRHPKP